MVPLFSPSPGERHSCAWAPDGRPQPTRAPPDSPKREAPAWMDGDHFSKNLNGFASPQNKPSQANFNVNQVARRRVDGPGARPAALYRASAVTRGAR